MKQVLPEGLKVALEAIPKPGPGQYISMSLSMTIRTLFWGSSSSRERLGDVVAIVSSSVYPTLVSLLEENIDEEVSPEFHEVAKRWLTDLWEHGMLVQPRFGGLIPDYAAGEWRWTGEPTAIPFREL